MESHSAVSKSDWSNGNLANEALKYLEEVNNQSRREGELSSSGIPGPKTTTGRSAFSKFELAVTGITEQRSQFPGIKHPYIGLEHHFTWLHSALVTWLIIIANNREVGLSTGLSKDCGQIAACFFEFSKQQRQYLARRHHEPKRDRIPTKSPSSNDMATGFQRASGDARRYPSSNFNRSENRPPMSSTLCRNGPQCRKFAEGRVTGIRSYIISMLTMHRHL